MADTDGVAVLFIPRVFGAGSRGECGKTSWAVVPAKLLPPCLVGRVFMSREPSMAGTSSLLRGHFNAGGTSVVAVRSAAPAAEAMEFAIHETFHGFQEKHFASLIGVSDIVSDSILSDSSFRASVEIERQMLRTILGIRDRRATRQLAKDYLEHRRVRLSLVEKRVREVERLLERKEGTAEVVGLYALAAAAKLPSESVVRDSTSVLLTRPLEEFPAGLDATWRLMRWRLYGTGAALCLILDRLNRSVETRS